jgi:hypothetical protein
MRFHNESIVGYLNPKFVSHGTKSSLERILAGSEGTASEGGRHIAAPPPRRFVTFALYSMALGGTGRGGGAASTTPRG